MTDKTESKQNPSSWKEGDFNENIDLIFTPTRARASQKRGIRS